MAFSLKFWKAESSKKLQGWKARFDTAATNSAYYFLAAVSFAPVVQAVHSGDWSALTVMGMTLGSAVGTNLLANMVQSLKDKNEDEMAAALSAAVDTQPDLKPALDALLETLETLPAAAKALSEEDKAWFEKTIQQELKNLNSAVKYEATLTGDGAIAQGKGAVAVGAGATYIGGDYHAAPDPKQAEKEREAEARTAYLTSLYRRCQSLPLAALGGYESTDEEITLDKVYTSLDTTIYIQKDDLVALQKGEKVRLTEAAIAKESPEIQVRRQEKKDVAPLPLWDAVRATPRVVVLGDPGAGKSTFVRKLLSLQASALLGESDPLQGFDPNLLPILIVLRELSVTLENLNLHSLSANEQKRRLLEKIHDHLKEKLPERAKNFFPSMLSVLESGQVLLVLDGLDEVPQALRKTIRQAVAALISKYHIARLIITSRIRSYTGDAVFEKTQTFTIRPFDEEKISNFVTAWYRAQSELGRISKKDSEKRAVDLISATKSGNLLEIASNPMLLTSMAIIHQKEIGLPRERVRLYKLVVEVLMHRWQKYRFGEKNLAPSPKLNAFLMDERRLLSALERLAYEAHRSRQGEKESSDLPRMRAIEILEDSDYLGKMDLAQEFLDYVDQRAGLLRGNGGNLDKPGSYSFPHRTFQEYLAGCYMVRERERSPWREYYKRAGEGEYWALAALLGAEELYFNRRNLHALLDLAYQLLPTGTLHSEQDERASLWSAKIAHIAGIDEIKADTESPVGGEKYLKRARSSLVKTLSGRLPAIERADAGRALAKLGDPRPEVMDVDALEFSLIPAGKFYLGSKKEEGGSDEHPQRLLNLNAFWMSRYPITNAHYAAFVADGGYQDERFWGEAKAAGVWQDGKVEGVWDSESREAPVNFGEPFDLSNHPVVGITWYEALAFTRWLNQRWQKAGILPKNWQVTLPSEAEWEKAARGGIRIPQKPYLRPVRDCDWNTSLAADAFVRNPMPQQAYPWGDAFDPNNANNADTGIGTTSAVGCFPAGASPYGVLDMSGNVWEWTRSIYGDYPYPESGKALAERENLAAGDTASRVLRGGAFFNNQDYVRCAYRGRHRPYSWLNGLGFRVVVVPILHHNNSVLWAL